MLTFHKNSHPSHFCEQAIYKVPAAGWLQIFALAGAIEADVTQEQLGDLALGPDE